MSLGLSERSFGFVQAVERLIGNREVGIAVNAVGIKLQSPESIGESIIKLTEAQVGAGNVVEGNRVAGIGLLVELERGDALVELARVNIVVRSDVQLLMLAGTVAQLEGFLPA